MPELKEINLTELILPIIETYKNQNFKIKLQNISSNEKIIGDKGLIELVFINLIKNSLEADAKKISITVNKQNLHTIIELSDNGKGIDPSTLKKVFLPFYTTKKEGSGIGLSLARQIMFAHNGNIEMESEPGKTSVKLFFKNDFN